MSDALFRDLSLGTARPAPARFRPGQTVRVHTKVIEGGKTRIQIFEGIVIEVTGKGPARSLTVRKISFNKVGVERKFPLFSPLVEKIEIKDQAKVRRAKLSWVRDEKAKKLRGKVAVGEVWSGEAAPEPEAPAEPAADEKPADAPAAEEKSEPADTPAEDKKSAE